MVGKLNDQAAQKQPASCCVRAVVRTRNTPARSTVNLGFRYALFL